MPREKRRSHTSHVCCNPDCPCRCAERPQLLVVTVAAVLAGAVGGDHVSPISDTTILASAGAQCHHLDHVNTQIPYVIVVASCSFIGYLAAGIADSGTVGFGVGLVVLLCSMGYIYKFLMKA